MILVRVCRKRVRSLDCQEATACLLPLLWSTVLHAAFPEKQEHEFRTWTSTDGRTLRAELLEFSDQQIKVKREKDMTLFEIPLENLAPADRKLVLGMVRERNRNNGLTQGSFASLITGQFSPGKSKDGLNFQLFGSPEWDGAKRYPLVVWLHGAGQSGKDNTSQLAGHPKQWFTRESQEKRPCFGLAPQCLDRDVGWKGQPAEDVVALIKNLEDELPIDETWCSHFAYRWTLASPPERGIAELWLRRLQFGSWETIVVESESLGIKEDRLKFGPQAVEGDCFRLFTQNESGQSVVSGCLEIRNGGVGEIPRDGLRCASFRNSFLECNFRTSNWAYFRLHPAKESAGLRG